MKRAAIGFLVLAFASVAQAGTLKHIGRDIYRGDSYYWRVYCVCGCWQYQRLGLINDYPAPGTPGFYDRFAAKEFEAEENQRQADLIKARFPNAVVQPQNILTTGYNVMQQGYQTSLVQGGTTLQATGAYISPVDVNGIIHEAQRLQELAGVNSSQANAQVNSIVNSAVDGNSRYASIIAAGQVSAAAIAAATPPTQQTTVFQSRSIASGPSVPTTASFATVQPSGDAVALLTHGLMTTYCAACHNPQKNKGEWSVTPNLDQLSLKRDAIEWAMHLPIDDPKHMPPRDKPQPNEAAKNGIVAGIPRQTFAAHAETPPIPQPQDQPPLPPQQ